MKFNVVGSDSRTGANLHMLVDAVNLEEAAATARRCQLNPTSITVADEPEFAVEPEPVSPPSRNLLRKTFCAVVVVAPFFIVLAPIIPGLAGSALLAAVAGFALLPRRREILRRVLGIRSEKPVQGATRLVLASVWGAILLTLSLGGVAMRAQTEREAAQRREQASRTDATITALVGAAEKALQDGDIPNAADLAHKAVGTNTKHRGAEQLSRKIETATNAERVLSILCGLPEPAFQALRESNTVPAALDFGYSVLNARALELARGQLERASSTRETKRAENETRLAEMRRRASSAPAERSTEKPTPKAKVNKIGGTVHVGYTTYAVWKAWWSDRLSDNQFLNQQPNAKFLFIDITVRNDDKKARTIPPFTLIDENGAEYDSDSSAWAIEGSLGLLTDLNPSVSKQGLVVFDVPPERTYRLKLDGGFWSSESALIEIVPGEQK